MPYNYDIPQSSRPKMEAPMNVKSKYADDSEVSKATKAYMRGGCGAPYNLASGPGRLDVSMLRVPRFLKAAFEALGWKTVRQPSEGEE